MQTQTGYSIGIHLRNFQDFRFRSYRDERTGLVWVAVDLDGGVTTLYPSGPQQLEALAEILYQAASAYVQDIE